MLSYWFKLFSSRVGAPSFGVVLLHLRRRGAQWSGLNLLRWLSEAAVTAKPVRDLMGQAPRVFQFGKPPLRAGEAKSATSVLHRMTTRNLHGLMVRRPACS